uniref:Mut7-C domain-containing protein n=1 Tax=Ascaris lumbricoides TaxID=6252 RepID=A0A0M3HKW7_ASCLU
MQSFPASDCRLRKRCLDALTRVESDFSKVVEVYRVCARCSNKSYSDKGLNVVFVP